jgi:hypothetical protein
MACCARRLENLLALCVISVPGRQAFAVRRNRDCNARDVLFRCGFSEAELIWVAVGTYPRWTNGESCDRRERECEDRTYSPCTEKFNRADEHF